jgi:hypothetical protein
MIDTLLALLATGVALAGGPGATVRTTAGETVHGLVAGYEAGGGLKLVQDDGGARTVPTGEIVQVRFAASATPLPAVDNQVEVTLLDGDRLRGKILSGDSERLKIDTAALGPVDLEIEHMRGLTFAPEGGSPPDLKAFLPDKPPTSDILFRRVSQGTDSISGTLEKLAADELQFDCALGKVKFPYASAAALVFAPQIELPAMKEPKIFLSLQDGGTVSGQLLELVEGTLSLSTLFAKSLRIDLNRIETLRFAGVAFEYLSDLDPVKVEELPYVGEASDFRFHYRRDASVTGQPLMAGGERCSKGLGVHSRCNLTYDVSKGYQRFEASYGLADEVKDLPGKASVIFRVYVDDQLKFESPTVRTGDPPKALAPISLKGAKLLRLEVDFADNYDIADRALWLEPVLIR